MEPRHRLLHIVLVSWGLLMVIDKVDDRCENSGLALVIQSDLSILLGSIDRDLSDRNRVKTFIQKITRAWQSRDFRECKRLLQLQPLELAGMYPNSSLLFEQLRVALQRGVDEHYSALESQLLDYCSEQSIPVTGQHGRFRLDYLLEVIIDRRQESGKVGNVAIVSPSWDKMRPAIERERSRIWGRTVDIVQYRDHLITLYEKAIRTNPNPTGWVRLADMYGLLKAAAPKAPAGNQPAQDRPRLVSYYKDEFAADLSRLIAAQERGEISGHVLEFSAIRDPRQAFQVVLPGGNIASYGFVRPRRD